MNRTWKKHISIGKQKNSGAIREAVSKHNLELELIIHF